MTDTYIDWRKVENIRPVDLPHKEQYYERLNLDEVSYMVGVVSGALFKTEEPSSE